MLSRVNCYPGRVELALAARVAWRLEMNGLETGDGDGEKLETRGDGDIACHWRGLFCGGGCLQHQTLQRTSSSSSQLITMPRIMNNPGDMR